MIRKTIIFKFNCCIFLNLFYVHRDNQLFLFNINFITAKNNFRYQR